MQAKQFRFSAGDPRDGPQEGYILNLNADTQIGKHASVPQFAAPTLLCADCQSTPLLVVAAAVLAGFVCAWERDLMRARRERRVLKRKF